MSYEYTDFDGDRLIIEAPGWPANTASVSVNGNAVFVKAAEAPKTAQAILDAAGVKGAVLTGELPKVTGSSRGTYRTENGIRWMALDSTDPYNDINTHIRGLLAIKLRMEADAKEAEGAKLTQQIKEAADFRANQARMEAENKAAAAKKAHDDLRTSPIALKALDLYNRGCIGSGPYASWDATDGGHGASDFVVKEYIRRAEAVEAKEKEAAEKLAARRDAIAQSLGATYKYEQYVHGQLIRKAVDRIIELEDK